MSVNDHDKLFWSCAIRESHMPTILEEECPQFSSHHPVVIEIIFLCFR